MSKKNKTLLIAGLALLLVIVGAFVWIYMSGKGEAQQGAKTITVDVILSDGTVNNTYEYHTDAENLRQVLADENGLIEGEDSEYGLFVLTVDGITADQNNQEWWCFTKGGESLMTGVDDTLIADGDKYEITLTVGYEGF